jgi:putative spermidine/putrescine transport system permease protein
LTDRRSAGFYWLAALFCLFVLFLYGPMITIVVLSFQGPQGGLTFPMNGISLHWFYRLWDGLGVVDIWAAFRRSARLGAVVMVLTVALSLLAGLAYRKRFAGSNLLFYVVVASLIVPSIVVSLGIGLEFRLLDDTVKSIAEALGLEDFGQRYGTAMGLFTSGLGAQLTWTLPFGLLICFAIFNRFDRRYEEAARDLGATAWQTVRHVIVPIVLPSLIGVGLFGFTLSYDEFARSLYTAGTFNTLPLEIYGMTTNVTTPVLYALGTVTTGLSFLVIALALVSTLIVRRRRERLGSDAGKAA